MKGISPVNVTVFQEENVWVIAVVVLFQKTVVEAGVYHEKNVAEVD